METVDTWIKQQGDKPSRPEAIRRLVEKALGILPAKDVSPERAAVLAIADRAEASSRAKVAAEKAKRKATFTLDEINEGNADERAAAIRRVAKAIAPKRKK